MKQEVTQSDQIDLSDKTINVVSSTIYKCTVCSKHFPTKSKLQQHSVIHDVKDNESLSCNICSKTFLNSSSLSRHLKTHQSKFLKYNNLLFSLLNIYLILYLILEDEQVLECTICKETYGHILILKDFAETDFNKEEIFTCPHHQKYFTSHDSKLSRGQNFYQKHECQFCLKCFPTADKLRMHLLKHSDRRYLLIT
jgi:stress-induced morphogen